MTAPTPQFGHILKTDKRSKSAGPLGICPSGVFNNFLFHRRCKFKGLLTISKSIYPLYTGNPWKGTLANSEDQDEMKHKAPFHQGLRFVKIKTTLWEIHYNLENSARDPLHYTMGSPILYWINMHGINLQSVKRGSTFNNLKSVSCRQ